ncbi:MAG: magnesium chelatase [Chloroflexi bacterium]|nr:magnesium chelatase [Chloroflexota bacterium]
MDAEPEPTPPQETPPAAVRSLRELLDRVTGRTFQPPAPAGESGIAEALPFPFMALVGQAEMKLALILALINPAVGGVLLIGPRGGGKTTAVRSLVDLLPEALRSLCHYGCLPEDIESGGMDAVCPDCARKFAQGEPIAVMDRVRLVELPLNARLEDVIGGLDERAAVHNRLRLRRGLLAQADRNLLFVDEVNLLADDVADALLDAASQGSFTVRRGPLAATYWSRFVLAGSMNPEEGRLRPQIMDRFGLRVVVRGLPSPPERLEAYRRVLAHRANPRQVLASYAGETALARLEIEASRELLPQVTVPEAVAALGLELISRLQIDSLRAEITLFEAARACAAADSRTEVIPDDLRAVAPMALRLRRSAYIKEYLAAQQEEENEMSRLVAELLPPRPESTAP